MAGRSAQRLALPPGLLATARIVGAAFAYLGVLVGATVLLYALGTVVVPADQRDAFSLIGLGIAYAAALATVLLAWRVVDRKPYARLGLFKQDAKKRWLKGAAIASLMMGFVVLVGYTLLDAASWDVNPDELRATVVLVVGLLGFAVQGPAEELLFRGYILENIRGQWGIRWAVVISSITFGLFHGFNPGFSPLPFVNLVLFGAGTAVYRMYVDDGALWGVFAIHTLWNWLQQVVFGLPNSGMATGPDYALFSVMPNRDLPDPFWGGGFGPEGTFAATLVLLGLLVGSLRLASRPRRP